MNITLVYLLSIVFLFGTGLLYAFVWDGGRAANAYMLFGFIAISVAVVLYGTFSGVEEEHRRALAPKDSPGVS